MLPQWLEKQSRGLRSPFPKKPLRRVPSPPSWVRPCSASPTPPSRPRSRSLARVATANAAGERGSVNTAGPYWAAAPQSMRPRKRHHRKSPRRRAFRRKPRRSRSRQHRCPSHRPPQHPPAPVKSSRRFRTRRLPIRALERATYRLLRRRNSVAKRLKRPRLQAQPAPRPFTAQDPRVRPATRRPRALLDRCRAPSPKPRRPRS